MCKPEPDRPFVAIDFETADYGRDSACAVALARVEGRRIVASEHRLIRPPRKRFVFTHLHGISWSDVRDEPPFAVVWPALTHLLEDAATLVAHNASFDRSVLGRCCEMAGLPMPTQPFECTVNLSRRTWRMPSYRLNLVCDHLHIPLTHHNALSDAEACARILIEIRRAAKSVG